jgi:hypothetical protein
MKFFLPLMIALLALAAACGGGTTPRTTPIPSEPSVDPNLLPSVVLQPSDLPPEYVTEAAFNPPGAATSYNSAFHLGGLTITSTVVQYKDVPTRDQDIDRVRRGYAKLIGSETTYRLNGSDAAFLYQSGAATPSQGSIILRGRYALSVSYVTNNLSQSAIATNRDELQRYSALVFDRLQKLLADPSSITPIAGAPTFDTSRQRQPLVITETPVP